uniref:Uncharacterized protein n=1 Tax=viral metagenome TaxID=1070528 RepID=A0A6C0ET96_9ZZZZ
MTQGVNYGTKKMYNFLFRSRNNSRSRSSTQSRPSQYRKNSKAKIISKDSPETEHKGTLLISPVHKQSRTKSNLPLIKWTRKIKNGIKIYKDKDNNAYKIIKLKNGEIILESLNYTIPPLNVTPFQHWVQSEAKNIYLDRMKKIYNKSQDKIYEKYKGIQGTHIPQEQHLLLTQQYEEVTNVEPYMDFTYFK